MAWRSTFSPTALLPRKFSDTPPSKFGLALRIEGWNPFQGAEVEALTIEVLDRMAMGVAETITEYELEVRMEPMPAWTFYDLDDLAGANSGRGCEVRFWSRSITRKERLNPSSWTSTCDRLTTLGGQPLRAEGLPANRPRVVGPERKYGT